MTSPGRTVWYVVVIVLAGKVVWYVEVKSRVVVTSLVAVAVDTIDRLAGSSACAIGIGKIRIKSPTLRDTDKRL